VLEVDTTDFANVDISRVAQFSRAFVESKGSGGLVHHPRRAMTAGDCARLGPVGRPRRQKTRRGHLTSALVGRLSSRSLRTPKRSACAQVGTSTEGRHRCAGGRSLRLGPCDAFGRVEERVGAPGAAAIVGGEGTSRETGVDTPAMVAVGKLHLGDVRSDRASGPGRSAVR
jgi:hypothetical protein